MKITLRWIAVLPAAMSSFLFAQVDTGPKPELEKVKHYFDAHMFTEALDHLQQLLKQDEFNPGLQFAVGEALLWMKKYPDAAHHFDVAQHLDKNFWQATWRQADAQFCVWE